MTTTPLVARDAQLARLDDLLSDTATARGLVVRGPRGCGLSALVDAGDSRARARGTRVLRANGVEAEAGFAYAGLHQLLRPLRRAFGALPAAQRDALAAALGGEATDAPANRFAVGLATLGVLTAAAADGPLLVCVDDAQWLDRETLDAIAFVGRRLDAQPIALLAGAHADEPFAELGLPELALGPLAPPDAEAMLDACAPGLDLLTRARVLDHAAGTPLALAELPVAFATAHEDATLVPWAPLTPRLAETFGHGLAALPAGTRRLLEAACLDDGDGRLDRVVAVARGVAADLAPALDGGLVVLDGERLAFAHGLTRAVVRGQLAGTERRALHARWAEVVAAEDPDRAVWHRVATAIGADAALAAELEDVARRSARAGEPLRALAGTRAAARLTPAGPARDDRLVSTAALAYEVGALELGDRALADVVAERLPPAAQARLATMTGRAAAPRGDRERPGVLAALARTAAAEGERDVAFRLLWWAAGETETSARRTEDVALLVATAREVADGAVEPAVLSLFAALDPRGHEDEVLDAVACAAVPHDPWQAVLLGHAALLTGDPHAAAGLLAAGAEGLRRQRRATSLARALALSAWAHGLLGQLERAARDAAEAEHLAGALRQGLWRAVARAALGLVAAWLGDDETAEQRAAAAERVALPIGAAPVLALIQHGRATAALTAGRPAEAHAHLLRLFDPLDPACEPGWAAGLVGDLADAAVTDAERATAARILAGLPVSRAPRLRVAAAHARFVLAGDDEDPDAAYARARAAVGGLGRWPLEDARMRLAYGMRLRRLRRVADSRTPLREAADAFAALGATPWAERAIRELAATTETANRRGDDDGRLTPQELEIARMAARGMTNREIAARLSLSPRTVGAHLAHVYPKLEIAGRGALADALGERGVDLV